MVGEGVALDAGIDADLVDGRRTRWHVETAIDVHATGNAGNTADDREVLQIVGAVVGVVEIVVGHPIGVEIDAELVVAAEVVEIEAITVAGGRRHSGSGRGNAADVEHDQIGCIGSADDRIGGASAQQDALCGR